MNENTPKSKEEMDKAIEDLQIKPEDLDAVVGGVQSCDTCYGHYSAHLTEEPNSTK